MQKKIDFISLGCAKNLVDSERLMYVLHQRGYDITIDPPSPRNEIAIINTCAFIADAKQESIDTILRWVQAKQEGKVRLLYVFGCLSQRYRETLKQEIPEVDGFFGKFDYLVLAQQIDAGITRLEHRLLTTPPHYAYLKIAEGCDQHCAYCIIPHITGGYRSRTEEEIVGEAEWLVGQGVKELQVIAQDITAYGRDLYGEQRLPALTDKLAGIAGVEWIRLHYGYPNNFPWPLLDVISSHSNVCNYLDVALQHVSDPVLTRMKRHLTQDDTYRFVERLRNDCPGIRLRTTMMVGFPGETDEDFQQLIDFVKWARFEMLGAFAYSEEEGTYSARHYADDVPDDVKQHRLDTLMAVQQDISEELMHRQIGQRYKVIVDRREGDYYVARSQYSSPEVDPEILIPAESGLLHIGEFYNVEITEATPFDLFGSVVA